MLRIALAVALRDLVLLYSTVLVRTLKSVVPAIVAPKYRHTRAPAATYCLGLFEKFMRDGAKTVFQAMKRFHALATVNAANASVRGLSRVRGVTGAIPRSAPGLLPHGALLWDGPSR